MKRSLFLILVISIFLFALVSCGGCDEHIDTNGDGVCEECGEAFTSPTPCTHAFDNDCDTSCNNDGCSYTRMTEHKDVDGNGICDICGYEYPPLDECEGHCDDDVNGKCDVCRAPVVAPSIDLSMLKMTDKTVTYTGKPQTLLASGTRPDGVEVKYTNHKQTDAGVYTVTAKYYYSGTRKGVTYKDMYLPHGDLSATFTIKPAKLDIGGILFEDKTVTYDGNSHSIEISGITLPEGVGVEFSGNDKTDAGTYTVICKFNTGNNYLPQSNITATLTIKKAVYNLYGVSFGSKVVGYDGVVHSIFVEGTLPLGVTASYVGNGVCSAGKHTVTAKLNGDGKNYEPIPDMTAYIEILSDKIAGLSLQDKTTVFDGQSHSLAIEGELPQGYTVEYVGGGVKNAGEHEVTAKFYLNGVYQEGKDLSAKLTIKKAIIDASAQNLTVAFDGLKHYIKAVGTLPFGVSVKYIGNGKALPGVYEVTVRFVVDTAEAGNIIPLSPITVKLTIEEPEFSSEGLIYQNQTVVGYKGNAKYVLIPAYYNGKKIISVDTEAFKNCTDIVYVRISDNVTNIGNNAFLGCSSLKYIELGSTVSVIGQNAFKNTDLREIVFPDSLTSIGFGALSGTSVESVTLPFVGGSRRTESSNTSNAYLGFIFGAGGYAAQVTKIPETLKTVIFSDGCEEIPAYSLYGCTGIENVVIGSGVKEIGLSAFQGMTAMKSIYIPKNVKTIAASEYDYNSPFFICDENLLIVLEAEAITEFSYVEGEGGYLVPGTGFGETWNVIEDEKKAEYKLGMSYDEYIELLDHLK